jgi:hypothetical protein
MTRKGISVTITSTYKSVTCHFVEIALLLTRTRVLKAIFVRKVISMVLKDRIFTYILVLHVTNITRKF